MVGAAGIEPATLGLEIRCSILLSYAPKIRQLQLQQGVPEISHMGYDLVKCLHRLSIAQPLHDCESNRGASWAASEVCWNLST
jgi:hypothetical protein